MRLYDEKRQKINICDIIEFSNESSDKTLKVKVINMYHFVIIAEI